MGDPFSMGSYSFYPPNLGEEALAIAKLKTPHPDPASGDQPLVFFAGEHTSMTGTQCVYGAFLSGLEAAANVLRSFGQDVRKLWFEAREDREIQEAERKLERISFMKREREREREK